MAADGATVFLSASTPNVLLLHAPDRGETREIASHPGFLGAPSLSPDGRTIAFSRAEPDGAWRVWLVSVDDDPPRRLTAGSSGELYPRFTPDGESVVFYSWQFPHSVYRVPLEGGHVVALTPEDEDDYFPAVSPDGRWLAFARQRQGVARVFVMPLGSVGEASSPALAEARPLTSSPSTVPSWSPDSQWIAFSPDPGKRGGIWVIARDGTGERRLTTEGGWPVWHPGGDEIAYQVLGPDGNLQLRAVPVEGGPSRLLTPLRFRGTNFPFAFSPDGSFLVTSNARHFNSEIWLLAPR